MIEAHHVTNMEGNYLENAIKSDFGLDITIAEKITMGYSSQVFRAKLDGKDVFVRINKDSNLFRVEQLGYHILERQGIPVPKIIALDDKPKSIGHPTMIMSAAEGSNLDDMEITKEQKDAIYERVGELLRKINETKVEGYGPLRVKDHELVGEFSSWREYCESQEMYNLKVLDFAIEKGFLTREDYDKVGNIYAEIALLDFGKASLLHRDMHHEHFFVKDGAISGVIDLGLLAAGDPRDDIAVSLSFQNSEQQEYFRRGYGALTNDQMVNKYLITMLLRRTYFRSLDEIKGNVDILLPILRKALEKL